MELANSAYDKWVWHIARSEGGWCKGNAVGSGESTRGITLKVFKVRIAELMLRHPEEGLAPTLHCFRAMTPPQAGLFYREYWDGINGDALPPSIAIYLGDWAFKASVPLAIGLFKKGVNEDFLSIWGEVDGKRAIAGYSRPPLTPSISKLGSQSVNTVLAIPATKLLDALHVRRTMWYRRIADARATQLQFLDRQLDRCDCALSIARGYL